MSTRSRLPAALICALFTVSASANPATQPARPTPPITRADLADAYLRAEQIIQQYPPSAADKVRVNRAMDSGAYFFFSANHSAAIKTMNELSDSLRPREQITPLRRIAESLKIRVSPPIANIHRPSIFNVRMTALYDVPIEQPLKLRLVIRADDADGKVVFDEPIEIRADGPLPSLSTRQPEASPGSYCVQLIGENGETVQVGRWFVVDRSLEVQRAANERRLTGIERRTPQILHALVACRGRNALLTDRPSEQDSSQFLMDPVELSKEVNDEVEVLLRGEDPYVGRTKEHYRTIPAGAMYIPARIYVPQSKDDKPMPLVIALHGAGADEAMFMFGYGAGSIRKLADEHGFIVVAPSTYFVMPNPSAFEGMISTLAFNYSIDRSRVYVIGHSLGAIAACGMVTRHPDDLAAAVLIAGGSFRRGDRICPTLMIAAEIDPIISARRLTRAAEEAQADGLPVELRVKENAGHILVAGDALPEAIEWLLQHRTGDR